MNDLLMFLLFLLMFLTGYVVGREYSVLKRTEEHYNKIIDNLRKENEELTKTVYKYHVEEINKAWKEWKNNHATDRT